MLGRRERVAEPGDVGDVHEQRCLRKHACDLGAVGVLVADAQRDLLSGDLERQLFRRTARKIGQRNRKHARDPCESRRHELAERHQVRLVVDLAGRGAQAHHAVVVRLRSGAKRHPEQHVAVVSARRQRQPRQERGLDPIEEARHRRLGQDDQPRARLLDEQGVGLQCARIASRIELEILRHVSLQQADADRRAGRDRPFDRA